MKLIAYVRVSKEIQEISPQVQRQKIEAFCALYNHEVGEWIEDIGESAKSLKRPGFQEVRRLLDKRKYKGLIVAKLDRLTRNLADWQMLIGKYFTDKVTLLAVEDCVNTRTASGRMVVNLLLTVAQWERETISERTKAALHEKRRRGERTGQVPYGWKLATDGIRLIPIEDQQAVIEQLKVWKQCGCGYAEMADRLNRDKVPTNSSRDRTKLWAAQKCRRILLRQASLA